MIKPIPESELILNKDGSVYHLKLRPEQIADTILAVGDPSRVAAISQYFDTVDLKVSNREFVTHTGTLNGKRVTAISTGIGTGNVEIFFNELDALVNIDLEKRLVKEKRKSLKIIRIGTSGAMREEIPPGSCLVSDYAVGLDTLMSFYCVPYSPFEMAVAAEIHKQVPLSFKPYCIKSDEKLKEQIGFDMITGNTLTCPGFYAPQARSLRLAPAIPDLMSKLSDFSYQNFRLTNIEMETAAYYAFGRMMSHEVLSVNAILASRVKYAFSTAPEQVVDTLIRKVLKRLSI